MQAKPRLLDPPASSSVHPSAMRLAFLVRAVLAAATLASVGLVASPAAAKCMMPGPTLAPAFGTVPPNPVLHLLVPARARPPRCPASSPASPTGRSPSPSPPTPPRATSAPTASSSPPPSPARCKLALLDARRRRRPQLDLHRRPEVAASTRDHPPRSPSPTRTPAGPALTSAPATSGSPAPPPPTASCSPTTRPRSSSPPTPATTSAPPSSRRPTSTSPSATSAASATPSSGPGPGKRRSVRSSPTAASRP
jgi:hypothetical protein